MAWAVLVAGPASAVDWAVAVVGVAEAPASVVAEGGASGEKHDQGRKHDQRRAASGRVLRTPAPPVEERPVVGLRFVQLSMLKFRGQAALVL